ncbi:MAG: hypothetical protein WCF77_04295 [Minisyncoccia bacterium]
MDYSNKGQDLTLDNSMNFNQPPNQDNVEREHAGEKSKNPYLEMRDKSRNGASELQKGIAEVQSAKYETTLYRLMERSGDSPELVNALNDFLRELDIQSVQGRSDESLTSVRAEALAHCLKESAEKLRTLGRQ